MNRTKYNVFLTACLVVANLLVMTDLSFAQNKAQRSAQITVDGKQHPEMIPDWMQWREFFNRVRVLADKAQDAGHSYWADTIGLTPGQVDHLITRARFLQSEEKRDDAERKKIVKSQSSKGTINSQFHQIEINSESRSLDERDSLKSIIGVNLLRRLESYVRLNIAPTIKIGKLVAK